MFHWYIDFYVPVGIVRDDIVVVVVDVAKRQHITCTVGTFRDRRNINILLISATLYLNQMIFRFDRLIASFVIYYPLMNIGIPWAMGMPIFLFFLLERR